MLTVWQGNAVFNLYFRGAVWKMLRVSEKRNTLFMEASEHPSAPLCPGPVSFHVTDQGLKSGDLAQSAGQQKEEEQYFGICFY